MKVAGESQSSDSCLRQALSSCKGNPYFCSAPVGYRWSRVCTGTFQVHKNTAETEETWLFNT